MASSMFLSGKTQPVNPTRLEVMIEVFRHTVELDRQKSELPLAIARILKSTAKSPKSTGIGTPAPSSSTAENPTPLARVRCPTICRSTTPRSSTTAYSTKPVHGD
jgi:hypothetical protein